MLQRGVINGISVGVIDGSVTADQKLWGIVVYIVFFEQFMESGV